ncbi:MAG: transglutaminase family protein [Chlamydiota bacterium]
MFKLLSIFLLLSNSPALFHSLDPQSIAEHFAFYELYPDSPEGKKALSHAWKLLSGEDANVALQNLPKFDLSAIISMVTRQSFEAPVLLKEEELNAINNIASKLANRQLKGAHTWNKNEILSLPSEEIDLARGLLLYQLEDIEAVKQYEANLDLIALQIQARLSEESTPVDKIYAINRFIFEEMQFRFPPHSLYAQDVDLYTFLPSVLDSRQGVCLGVSILYLALAQRLNLSLEIITPPGHIYVRYRDDDTLINIETTARGIHLPNEVYLGINTRKLEQKQLKEVIGCAFINEASVYISKGDFAKAATLYDKARPFLPNDPLLDLLQGFMYVFIGKTSEGKKFLKNVRNYTFDHAVSPETMPEDYLLGRANIEGIKAIFLPVDETRASILEKQKQLQTIVKKHPKFRAGILQLATTWLQLGRLLEAQEVLEKYHCLDSQDSTVEYYLSIIALHRLDYNKAWQHLKIAEALVQKREHNPKALTELRHELHRLSPET